MISVQHKSSIKLIIQVWLSKKKISKTDSVYHPPVKFAAQYSTGLTENLTFYKVATCLPCECGYKHQWDRRVADNPAFSIDNTRNTLDCDQSNYSSRIVFSHIPIEFGQTGNSVIQSADPENPTVEPNMKWIGRPLAEIWPFEIFPDVTLVGRRSVGRQYILLLTLFSYTPLRYVRNVAHEE